MYPFYAFRLHLVYVLFQSSRREYECMSVRAYDECTRVGMYECLNLTIVLSFFHRTLIPRTIVPSCLSHNRTLIFSYSHRTIVQRTFVPSFICACAKPCLPPSPSWETIPDAAGLYPRRPVRPICLFPLCQDTHQCRGYGLGSG
jgi:hypothetical protein